MLVSEPPHAEAAEVAILTLAFNDPDRYVPKLRASGVEVETFWKWRPLAREILRFYDDNGALETIAFHQDLITRGTWAEVGGENTFEIIRPSPLTGYGWTKWIEQIQECHALRLARQFHQKDPDEYSSSEDAEQSLQDALEAVRKAKTTPSRSWTAKESADAFLQEFLANRDAGTIPGKSTGVPEIDHISGGMRPGELWVVCGQTSRGKSVLMLQMAAEVIMDGGMVAIFSLEMSKEEIVARMVSLMARIDFGQIMQPRLLKTKHDLDKLKETVVSIAESRFHIDDSAGQTLDHIQTEVAHLADRYGKIDLIMIDYVQLMEGGKGKGETREQEIARFSRGMKQLAKKTGCPVVTGSQLNDEGKVRESRAISHDANSLLFIVDEGVKIGKMRNGKRDQVIPIWLNGQYQKFTPVKPQSE